MIYFINNAIFVCLCSFNSCKSLYAPADKMKLILSFIHLLNLFLWSLWRMERVRNEEVRVRAGIGKELASRADQRVLRWFEHVERMDDYRMARRVLMAKVGGGRVRERPRLGWMDGVKVALGNSGITVERSEYMAQVYGLMSIS